MAATAIGPKEVRLGLKSQSEGGTNPLAVQPLAQDYRQLRAKRMLLPGASVVGPSWELLEMLSVLLLPVSKSPVIR